ncbi:hypothetical protein DICVIV_08398 [Dictyocaulus viviparus]|uniref:Uncharacterized protein n=1 Tax=Dictyocaulus viviparus TaxID=29172 RepID=A0A0D8XT48_DICVI|nr:hypothetical protein DICVIV_08398 [Dictyocaulus viviparus]
MNPATGKAMRRSDEKIWFYLSINKIKSPVTIRLKPPIWKKTRDEIISLKVTIRDAECYSAPTNSSFSVHLLALDFNDRFLDTFDLRNEQFKYNETTTTRVFKTCE